MGLDYFNDLEFIRFNYVEASRNIADKRVFDGYYVIQFILCGHIYAQFGDGPREEAEGPLFFITYPGVPMSYGNMPGTIRSHAWIAFKGPRVERYIQSGLLQLRKEHYFTPVVNPQEIFTLFQKLFSVLTPPLQQDSQANAVLLLEELLIKLSVQQMKEKITHSNYFHQLESLQNQIVKSPELDWNFEHEAKKLQLSVSHFRQLFQEATGQPPHKFVLLSRIRLAQHLLVITNLRISEIAEQCGFSDGFHLYRAFFKYVNETPNTYRKRYWALIEQ